MGYSLSLSLSQLSEAITATAARLQQIKLFDVQSTGKRWRTLITSLLKDVLDVEVLPRHPGDDNVFFVVGSNHVQPLHSFGCWRHYAKPLRVGWPNVFILSAWLPSLAVRFSKWHCSACLDGQAFREVITISTQWDSKWIPHFCRSSIAHQEHAFAIWQHSSIQVWIVVWNCRLNHLRPVRLAAQRPTVPVAVAVAASTPTQVTRRAK